MSKKLRQVLLFGAPLLVGMLNVFHPVHFEASGVYDSIHTVAAWWIALHVLNLFGFALVGLSGCLLMAGEQGMAPRVARFALGVFVPAYVGFDAIIGIGTGNLVQYANRLPLPELGAFKPAIDAFWSNSVSAMLAVLGSVSWSLAMLAAAITFTDPRRRAPLLILGLLSGIFTGGGYASGLFGSLPWWIGLALIGLIGLLIARPVLPPTLLILAGVLFGTTHVVPFGPLGMACFLAAAALLQLVPGTVTVKKLADAQA